MRQLFIDSCESDSHSLTAELYLKMMKKLEFKYLDSVIEESFDFFDLDKNGAVSYEEFQETIYKDNQTVDAN